MGSAKVHLSISPLIILIIIISIFAPPSTAQTFKCSTTNTTSCHALIDYVSPNTTTLSSIKTLFGVKNLRTLLGANNYPLSTSPNLTIVAKQKVRIPFPCVCANGTGTSNHRPIYTVQKDDGLYHIAAEVFSGLVKYQQIMAVNNITNENLIDIGQELWIPLPCSCDDVGGMKVVHYGHVVDEGSSVELIAQEFNTSLDTLLTLNGISDPKSLQAGVVLDVPLKACSSMVANNSLDSPLLVSNGTYVFTANNCVMCKCDSSKNWTLQCEPSQIKPSNNWSTCPSMQCKGADNFYLSNSTSSGCNSTTCAYGGYTNQTIITALALESTCPASDNSAPRIGMKGSGWNLLFISLQLAVLCLHFL